MKLRTAKCFFLFSKFMFGVALLFFAVLAVFCVIGRVPFKYLSLPVMSCFISITWMVSTKAVVHVMEQEERDA